MRSQGPICRAYFARLLAGCVCLSFLFGPAAIAGRRPVATPAPPPRAKAAKKPAAKPTPKAAARRPETPAQRKIREEAEKRRLARLRQARAKALPYWQRLIRDHPHSRYLPDALYNAGVLLIDAGKYTEAAKHLASFIEKYPNHPLVGFAALALIDVELERLFDLKSASKHAAAAVAWLEARKKTQQDKKTKPIDWAEITRKACIRTESTSSRDIFKRLAYDLYFRAGVVAYLQRDKNKAAESFGRAGNFELSLRKRAGAQTATERMIRIVQGKMKPLTPHELLALVRGDRQNTGIQLADLYLMAFHPAKAADLYKRLLTGDKPFPFPGPGVQAYLLLRIGQAMEFQGKHQEAMAYLKRLYHAKHAKYPWTADGIFRIATWTHNATQDPASSMKHWEYVFTKNPKHPEAERSLFYYGLSAMRMKDYRRAARAFAEYLQRYPDSRWTKRIARELLPQAKEMLKKETDR